MGARLWLFSLSLVVVPSLAGADATPRWRSGFESGFPGSKWNEWQSGSYSAKGAPVHGFVEAWTLVGREQFARVLAGEWAYKGWVFGQADGSHRPYPVLHCDIPGPVVNSFWVYVDLDYQQLSSSDWIQLGTWANNEDWDVHTLTLGHRGKLLVEHVDWPPEYLGPEPQPDFPLRRWVRLTTYLEYRDSRESQVWVWQDGVPQYRATFSRRAGTRLRRAHWGYYSNGEVNQGLLYNDEIQLWSLSEPWSDISREPPSPYDVQLNVPRDPVGQRPGDPSDPTQPPARRLVGGTLTGGCSASGSGGGGAAIVVLLLVWRRGICARAQRSGPQHRSAPRRVCS